MKIYRDPDTGRFISKEEWEQIQRELESDDFDDFDDFGDPEEYESPD
jgi:hypothetical protein